MSWGIALRYYDYLSGNPLCGSRSFFSVHLLKTQFPIAFVFLRICLGPSLVESDRTLMTWLVTPPCRLTLTFLIGRVGIQRLFLPSFYYLFKGCKILLFFCVFCYLPPSCSVSFSLVASICELSLSWMVL